MAARQNAARNLLQQQLPTRTDADELDGLVQEFRHWFRTLPDGTSIEDMANGAMDIADGTSSSTLRCWLMRTLSARSGWRS